MREPSQKSLSEKLKKQEERLRLREERMAYVRGLPHLHGWKWYKWAREFFESTNRQNFLCAANQISKCKISSDRSHPISLMGST